MLCTANEVRERLEAADLWCIQNSVKIDKSRLALSAVLAELFGQELQN